MNIAAKIDGEVNTSMANDDPTTLHTETTVTGTVEKFGMQGFDGTTGANWIIMAPMQSSMIFRNRLSVPDDSESTELSVLVHPLDTSIRIGDAELLLEFTRNLLALLFEYAPKLKVAAKGHVGGKEIASAAELRKETEQKNAKVGSSSLVLKAVVERVSLTAINDKTQKAYPFAIMKLEGITTTVALEKGKGKPDSTKDVDALIKSVSCELGLPSDSAESYSSFMYIAVHTFDRRFGMTSLSAKVGIDTEQNVTVKAGMKRLFLKDTQTVLHNETSCPLLAKNFEVSSLDSVVVSDLQPALRAEGANIHGRRAGTA